VISVISRRLFCEKNNRQVIVIVDVVVVIAVIVIKVSSPAKYEYVQSVNTYEVEMSIKYLFVESTAMPLGFSLAPTISKLGLPPNPAVDSTPSLPLPGSVKYSSSRDESRARDENVLPASYMTQLSQC